MNASQRIALDHATPGMVLAEDLLDRSGNVLLPATATLSDGTLGALRRRGIDTLLVAVPDAPPDPAALGRQRERQRERLQVLLRHSASQGAGPSLLACLEHYRGVRNE